MHFDGTSWLPMTSPVTEDINSIWGRSASDIYAVGDSGVQLHYDGSTWSAMGAIPHPVGIVSDVHGTSSNTYCVTYGAIEGGAGGGELMSLYGNWESRTSEHLPEDETRRLNAVFAQESTGNIYVGGWNSADGFPVLFEKSSGGGLINIAPNFDKQAILGIWGAGNTTYFAGADYTVGDNNIRGVISRLANNMVTRYEFNGYGDVWDSWGVNENNVFFSLNNGQILHFNGVSWINSVTNTNADLYGVWCSAEDDVYAVGENGTILHFDNVGPTTPAILTTPANGSVQPGTSVSYSWTPVAWADSYRLQISETDDMTQLVYNQNVGLLTYFNINGFLNYGRPYFWRVIAENDFGEDVDSNIFMFENGTAVAPILTTPRNNSRVYGSLVRFAWHQFENSTGYYFQLSFDANFSNVWRQGMVYNNEITLGDFQNDGTQYYWRIVGHDGSNWGTYWSSTSTFVNGNP